MSQPFDRGSFVAAPGPLDPSLGEFWVENPWDIISRGHNLSAFERKVLVIVAGYELDRSLAEVLAEAPTAATVLARLADSQSSSLPSRSNPANASPASTSDLR